MIPGTPVNLIHIVHIIGRGTKSLALGPPIPMAGVRRSRVANSLPAQVCPCGPVKPEWRCRIKPEWCWERQAAGHAAIHSLVALLGLLSPSYWRGNGAKSEWVVSYEGCSSSSLSQGQLLHQGSPSRACLASPHLNHLVSPLLRLQDWLSNSLETSYKSGELW